MGLVLKRAYNAQCNRCLAVDESSETGAPWYYDDPLDALERLRESGWVVADYDRMMCPSCAEQGLVLAEPRCTCPAGRGTNPGCPVCP